MVAIQHDSLSYSPAARRPMPCDPAQHRPARPQLRVLEGGRSPARLTATYRRRRLAVAIAALSVVVLLVLGAGALVATGRSLVTPVSGAAVPAEGSAAAATVVARPGDTMWSIAERLPHHGDVRPLVDRLVSLNGGTRITAGQRVLVPAR